MFLKVLCNSNDSERNFFTIQYKNLVGKSKNRQTEPFPFQTSKLLKLIRKLYKHVMDYTSGKKRRKLGDILFPVHETMGQMKRNTFSITAQLEVQTSDEHISRIITQRKLIPELVPEIFFPNFAVTGPCEGIVPKF